VVASLKAVSSVKFFTNSSYFRIQKMTLHDR